MIIIQAAHKNVCGKSERLSLCTHFVVTYCMHTGDGSHPTDVDLGTLGRRPFAMREEDTTGSETVSFSITLESISETSGSDTVSPPLASVARESVSNLELQGSSQDDSACSGSSAAVESSNRGDEYISSGGLGAPTKSGDQSDLGGELPANLSAGQEVCHGKAEGVGQGDIGSGGSCETDTGTARAETKSKHKSQRSSQKERRRSSFLISVFNRHDSFTPSFVKPSQSVLRQKAAKKAARRRLRDSEGAISEVDVTSEESQLEEIEVPERLSGGGSDRERLLDEEEELSLTRRVLKRVGQSIRSSLFDLRLFLW